MKQVTVAISLINKEFSESFQLVFLYFFTRSCYIQQRIKYIVDILNTGLHDYYKLQ